MGGQGPPTLFSLPSRSLGHRDEEAIVDEPPPIAEAGRGYFLSPPPPAYESYHGQVRQKTSICATRGDG